MIGFPKMTKWLLAATLLSASLTAAPSSLAERADAVILDMLGAVSAAENYEARILVQTARNGILQDPEGLLIRQRRDPACLYLKWLAGSREAGERVFCSEEPLYNRPVRKRAKTLINRRVLSKQQIASLRKVLSPVDDDGIYGMVARYANQYFDAAEDARPGDFAVGLRQATVFKHPATCLQIRRKEPQAGAPFEGQSEICVDDRSKLPSSFRQWNNEGVLIESYLMGDYSINMKMTDADFEISGN